ncbi:MAG: 50S ribosomal protein L9 [Candidatus Wallbacteria bacterium HGW-Wallbacteria-1]|jgi:large subunit ribosomal protein L9|uniref:Large ribosomal subunit protein bL9 n=1 Tax=Candidatus Wallbacteria bacterium HGW-Wallbacteria-1 TaxID=2013854 RepID=A0A2N1PUK9_9BACT|nr:MAG: 50S ribosomal protein L9 [Candidatus Wallbacteria bacterium HGW-Wallbacteria-1]
MKIILKESVPKLGAVGDVVVVRDGYARNFLIPKDLAMKLTAGNLKMVEQFKKKESLRVMAEEEKANHLAAQIAKHEFHFTARAGKGDKLFGSITSAQIAEAMAAKLGVEIDKRDLVLEHSIKTLGTHEVKINLFREIKGLVKVIIEAEEGSEMAAEVPAE